MIYKVIEIINENTFKISPNWEHKGKSGNIVIACIYKRSEKVDPERNEGKEIITRLRLEKEVEITNYLWVSPNEELLCDVFYEGRNIANYLLNIKNK